MSPPDSDDRITTSALLDRLTTVDEKLVDVATSIDDLAERVDQHGRNAVDLLAEIGEASGVDDVVTRNSYQFEMSTLVEAGTTRAEPDTVEREIPWDGRITSVMIGWPDGANQAVGVQIRESTGEVLLPRNYDDDGAEYVGLNDTTHPFDLRHNVTEGDKIVARFVNNDESNDHFINVVPTIRERGGQ